MTLHDNDEQFEALLSDAMKSRPAPAPTLDLAQRAMRIVKPQAAGNATRNRVINAVVGVVIIAMVVAIVIFNPIASSTVPTEAQSLTDDEILLFIVAATIGVAVLLAIESCLRAQRTMIPQLRY